MPPPAPSAHGSAGAPTPIDRRAAVGRLLDAPGRQVIIATLLVALVLSGWFAQSQRQAYEEAVSRVERDSRNVAHLLAEHAARTFDAVGETLRAVGRLRADVARGIYRSQASIFINLRTLHGGSPLLDEIGWFDAYGERVATSRSIEPVRISIARQEFFQVHVDGKGGSPHVSRPNRSDNGVSWLIDFSQRLENLDGSFAGIAHGTLDARRFAEVYAALDLGAGHEIALLRHDGIVLARSPDDGALLADSKDHGVVPSAARRGGTGGTYHEHSATRNVAVIGSYAVVPRSGGQLIVDMNFARGAALAEFWRSFAQDAGKLGVALIVLLAGAGFLAANLNRREALLTALATATATAAAAEEAAARIAVSEAALQRALIAEREMSAQQRRFIAIASHEFRTPLTIIDGAAQRLQRHLAQDMAEPEKLLFRIRSAVVRMIQIIERTVSLSRVDSGQIEVKGGQFDVTVMLRGVCARHGDLSPEFAIEVNAPAEPVFVTGDALLLEQSLGHVLSNAIKYSGRSRRIEVSIIEGEQTIDLIVRDFGVGIPAGDIPKLFTRFYRASTAGNVPGLGVGLHVVQSIMALQGGNVSIDSVLDRGTTVTLRLPRPRHALAGGQDRKLMAAEG